MTLCTALAIIGVGGYMVWNGLQRPNVDGMPAAITIHSSTFADGDLLHGQWSYMPGITKINGQFVVKPEGFAIVQQDGSGGQANPPINEYGVHLVNATDFAINAHMTDIHGSATLQLYGQLPIIADEFRVERKSVQVTVADGQLSVKLWNGRAQTAAVTQTAALTGDMSDVTLLIAHQNKSITFATAGATVTISDNNIFRDGNVWFGLDAAGGPWTLAGLNATSLTAKALRTTDTSTLIASSSDAATQGLQQVAQLKRPDFIVGAAMALGPAVADPAYAQTAFGGNFGAITPENAMKWQFIEPQNGIYDFKEADALVNLAQRHNMKVQAHTLVFGEANPAWVQQLLPSQLEATMIDHIKTVAGHYKGKIFSWDVVNEPFSDDNWDQLRTNIWEKAMGESYISKAFIAAHDADPNALLFMNEYGLEEDGSRWDNFLALVTKLKQQGVPIDGVGFQSHVYSASDKIDPAVLQKHMQQLAAIGVKSRVSEMDVYDDDGTGVQTQQYTAIFNACLSEPSCISWTSWGVSDRYDYFIDDDGSIQQGHDFLWDENMKPTPALAALLQQLQQ